MGTYIMPFSCSLGTTNLSFLQTSQGYCVAQAVLKLSIFLLGGCRLVLPRHSKYLTPNYWSLSEADCVFLVLPHWHNPLSSNSLFINASHMVLFIIVVHSSARGSGSRSSLSLEHSAYQMCPDGFFNPLDLCVNGMFLETNSMSILCGMLSVSFQHQDTDSMCLNLVWGPFSCDPDITELIWCLVTLFGYLSDDSVGEWTHDELIFKAPSLVRAVEILWVPCSASRGTYFSTCCAHHLGCVAASLWSRTNL